MLLLSVVYVFTNLYVALLALFIVFTLIISSILLLFLIKGRVHIEIESNWSSYKTEKSCVQVNIKNNSILPMTKIKCVLLFHNQLTQEKMTKEVYFIVKGKGYEEVPLSFHSEQVGKININIEKLIMYDYLHICAITVPIKEAGSTYVIPHDFPINVRRGRKETGIKSEVQYVNNQVDPSGSDMVGIKEYTEEDHAKHIHWKLTNKFDFPIVKEFSEPINEHILVLYNGVLSDSSQAISTKAEVFLSLSKSLINQGYEHDIGWFDDDIKQVRVEEIHMMEQISSLQSEILALKLSKDENNIMDEFIKNTFRYSHIYFITSEVNCYSEEAISNSNLTQLVYALEAKEIQNINPNKVAFSPNTLAEDLSYLTV